MGESSRKETERNKSNGDKGTVVEKKKLGRVDESQGTLAAGRGKVRSIDITPNQGEKKDGRKNSNQQDGGNAVAERVMMMEGGCAGVEKSDRRPTTV